MQGPRFDVRLIVFRPRDPFFVRFADPGQCADGSSVFVRDGYEFTDSFGQLTHLPAQSAYLMIARFTGLHKRLDSLVYRHCALHSTALSEYAVSRLPVENVLTLKALNRCGNRRGFNSDHRGRLLAQTLTLIHAPVRFGQ
jgi:hypothetical protein